MIYTIVESILPIFLVISIGWIAGKRKIVEFKHRKSLINFVTIISLPLLLFETTLKTSIESFTDFKILSIISLGLSIAYYTSYFAFKIFFKVNLNKLAIASLTSSFPNVTFMGIPVLLKLYDESVLIMIILMTIIANVLLVSFTVINIENHKNKNINPIKHLLKIFNTPMILAPILGLIFSYFNINFPEVFHSAFSLIGNTAPAVALFVMGIGISNSKLTISKEISLMIFIKNIITPLIFFILLISFHIKGEIFEQILLISAIPTAAIAPMFASQYEAYEIESNSASIIGTFLSIVTLGIIIYLIN